MKYKLEVIYGEEAAEKAAETSAAYAKRLIARGDLEGAVGKYAFDTENDRRIAEEILADHDGWGSYFFIEKNK